MPEEVLGVNRGYSDRLNCFLDFSGSETAGTDTNALNGALFHNPHILKIRIKLAGPNIMRVRNRPAEYRTLSADVALHWHLSYSC
jgi:hypothetical protein